MTYEYYDASNRLKSVDGSADENYRYDEIGNLTADVEEGIDSIAWTPYGKVRTVFKNDDSEIHFRYDAAGNRIAKVAEGDITTYVRDASGNVMGLYKNGSLIEQAVYGSSRLGLMTASSKSGYRTLGGKKYELSNHLGNVLAIISDNINFDQDSTWASVFLGGAAAFGSAGNLVNADKKQVTTIDLIIGINDKGVFQNVTMGGTTYSLDDFNNLRTSKPAGPFPREDKDK